MRISKVIHFDDRIVVPYIAIIVTILISIGLSVSHH